MTAEIIIQRLRTFLFFVTGFIFMGTVVELLLTEHMETAMQYIPFILSGIGLITIVIPWDFGLRRHINFSSNLLSSTTTISVTVHPNWPYLLRT